MKNFFSLPAPAKLNLFLHIVGQRPDGMHLIQSAFQLVDLNDYIDLEELPDGQILRNYSANWPYEDDLCVKAARLLQKITGCHKGVRITTQKHIPVGAGMGGGSSDAATCLIGLNRLWDLNLSSKTLLTLGNKLGADVPFFIFGKSAIAEGVGEILTPVEIENLEFFVCFPNVHVSTKEIFSSPDLTRNSKCYRISTLSEQLRNFSETFFGSNDLQPVVRDSYPVISEVIDCLKKVGSPRMTGSGSAVFCAAKAGEDFQKPSEFPDQWKSWTVKSLREHPLLGWLT